MVNLVCFIASHVTKSRFPFVVELFASIKSQTVFCPIFLSWHAEDEETKTLMQVLLDETKVIIGKYSNVKLSQFEHYATLLPYAKENSYVMFSDDDDLWSTDRMEIMQKALEHCIDNKFKFSRIIFPDYAELYINGKSKRKEYKDEESKLDLDHWAIIVPSIVLKEFLTTTPKWIIGNRYCDSRFCLYTRADQINDLDETAVIDNDKIPYTYRIRDDGMCEGAKKVTHRFADNLKGVLDIRIVNILAKCLHEDVNTFINYFNINLEIAIIKLYPDTDSIKRYLLNNCFIIRSTAQEKIIHDCINRLWPAISQWIHTTYNV